MVSRQGAEVGHAHPTAYPHATQEPAWLPRAPIIPDVWQQEVADTTAIPKSWAVAEPRVPKRASLWVLWGSGSHLATSDDGQGMVAAPSEEEKWTQLGKAAEHR